MAALCRARASVNALPLNAGGQLTRPAFRPGYCSLPPPQVGATTPPPQGATTNYSPTPLGVPRPIALSGRLPVVALVSRYLTNKLIGRAP